MTPASNDRCTQSNIVACSGIWSFLSYIVYSPIKIRTTEQKTIKANSHDNNVIIIINIFTEIKNIKTEIKLCQVYYVMESLFTLKRLTPKYALMCIGQLCIYYSHGTYVIRRIIRTSASGKTMYVAHIAPNKPSHYLEILSRKVYHIVEIHPMKESPEY